MQPSLFSPLDALDLADTAPGVDPLSTARPYQLAWADATMARWAAGPRCLGVAATGTGKTFLAALLARRVRDGGLDAVVPGNRRAVLFMNQRVVLTAQSAAEFAALLPDLEVEVEQGEERARGDGAIISACLQSLSPWRLRALGADRVQAVVWDEAHRYGPTHKLMRRVTEFFGPAVRHLGITATPDREDGKLGEVFGALAFDYGIWDAVADGYLVPPYLAYEICGDVTLHGCPVGDDGDFSGAALSQRMSEAGPVAAVVKAAIKWSNYANKREGRRPTVVSCSSVAHARLVADQLNEWDRQEGTGPAAAVAGELEPGDNARFIREFKAGGLQYICHFDVLTEGFDSDRPKVLVNGRPTRCRWVFAQNAGRILRPLRDVARRLGAEPDAAARRAMIAGSAKPGAVIVDVAGTDHKLAVDLLDVYRPGALPPAEVEEVRRRAADRAAAGLPSDPAADFAALRRLRREAEQQRWHGVRVDADLTTRMGDPFGVKVVPGREPPWVRGKRPTEKMRAALERCGLPAGEASGLSFWQAKHVLDVAAKRRAAGLCSYKQHRLLARFEIDGGTLTFEEARAEIDRLAANGWRKAAGHGGADGR